MNVSDLTQGLIREMSKSVVGQQSVCEQLTAAILADGHVLLEGVPGVAKTLMVRTLAAALDIPYGRIQFTPDMMPSDVLGTNVLDPRTAEFVLRKGPIFVGVLLADEINRTPPKTQSALLEAMEERHVTIDGEHLELPAPFLVFATQNPIDFEGTYPLPEAQQDRFLLKIEVNYPPKESEIDVLRKHHAGFRPGFLAEAGVQKVTDMAGLAEARKQVTSVVVEDKIFDYIYAIVDATRKSVDLAVGGSPRAGIAMLKCSKAIAAMRGRDFVIPDDVKELATPILRHRVILRPEAEVEGLTPNKVLQSLVDAQVVPR